MADSDPDTLNRNPNRAIWRNPDPDLDQGFYKKNEYTEETVHEII
jgi:hypothetical protein